MNRIPSSRHRGPALKWHPYQRHPMLSVVESTKQAPFFALSLRQPWAHIVLYYGKRIENRKWCTEYRGPIILHASKTMTMDDYDSAIDALEDVDSLHAGVRIDTERDMGRIKRGGFVGTANIVGVIPPRPAFEAVGANRDIEHWYRGHGFVGEWRWHFREQYGFILEDVQPKPFVEYKGALGIFPVQADPWPNLVAATTIVYQDGCVLAVWNPRYKGWALPGGLVEEGESRQDAAFRELEEETFIRARAMTLVHHGAHGGTPKLGRASFVSVFRVDQWEGIPREREDGCPVQWMAVTAFLEGCPFRDFYAPIFAAGRHQ